MKKIFYASISLVLFSFIIPGPTAKTLKTENIYQFKVPALLGGTIDFSAFKGKMILVEKVSYLWSIWFTTREQKFSTYHSTTHDHGYSSDGISSIHCSY